MNEYFKNSRLAKFVLEKRTSNMIDLPSNSNRSKNELEMKSHQKSSKNPQCQNVLMCILTFVLMFWETRLF